MEKFQSYLKISRESFIRQSIGSFAEKGDLANGLREARDLADTKFINNLKSKEKMSRRPHGQSFEAVAVVKKKDESQDKYLIYKMDDGSETNEPFVFKSSKRKAKILRNLDKDGVHPLASETVYLDVLHSYTKGWKTYTLSHYDILIRQMVRLCTMVCPKEDRICCELFFRLINKMLQEYICDEEGLETTEYVFNPYQC